MQWSPELEASLALMDGSALWEPAQSHSETGGCGAHTQKVLRYPQTCKGQVKSTHNPSSCFNLKLNFRPTFKLFAKSLMNKD